MRYIFLVIIMVFLAGCEEETSKPKFDDGQGDATDFEGQWLIPENQIDNSPAAMDIIPSIDNPKFKELSKTEGLDDQQRVLVYKNGSTVKIYPHQYIAHHEVVNDMTGGTPHAITFCPITGSGINWGRKIAGKVTEFGVSGMLYNRNLMPYDRNTESFWSQMMLKCVNGVYYNKSPEVLDLVETNWGTARILYEDALVLVPSKLGDYGKNPGLKNNSATAIKGDTLYGIIAPKKTYLFSYDQFGQEVTLRQPTTPDGDYLVAGSQKYRFIVGFNPKGTKFAFRDYEALTGRLPEVMKDDFGNVYTIFGEIVSGPEQGEEIPMARGYVAKSFAMEDFFPDYSFPLE